VDPEITLVGDGDSKSKPISAIGLEPLGKILVQLCIDPKRYEEDRALGQGHDLDPVPCASSRELAYKFRPEAKIQVQPTSLPVQRKSHVVPVVGAGGKVGGGERKGGVETPTHIDPEALLPGATSPQVVSYWRRCSKESHLTDHFRPDAVVDQMRPSELHEDRLGLLMRLRVNSATYMALADRLGQPNPPEVGEASLAALDAERERLTGLLAEVRRKLLGLTSQDRRTLLSDDEILKLGPETGFLVLEQQRERRRLEALRPKT